MLATSRIFAIFASTASAGWLVGQGRQTYTILWMTLVSQAGFALGIAAEIALQVFSSLYSLLTCFTRRALHLE
jgi:hypothetical protein